VPENAPLDAHAAIILHQHEFLGYSPLWRFLDGGVTQTNFRNVFGVPENPPLDVHAAIILHQHDFVGHGPLWRFLVGGVTQIFFCFLVLHYLIEHIPKFQDHCMSPKQNCMCVLFQNANSTLSASISHTTTLVHFLHIFSDTDTLSTHPERHIFVFGDGPKNGLTGPPPLCCKNCRLMPSDRMAQALSHSDNFWLCSQNLSGRWKYRRVE